jgi:hypothetical protein
MKPCRYLPVLLALGLLAVARLGAQSPGANPYGVDQALYLRLLGEWIAPSPEPADPALGSGSPGPSAFFRSGADLRFSIGRDEAGFVGLDLFDGASFRVVGLSAFDRSCLRLDLAPRDGEEGSLTLLVLFLDERHALLGDGSELDQGYFVDPDLPIIRLAGPGLP